MGSKATIYGPRQGSALDTQCKKGHGGPYRKNERKQKTGKKTEKKTERKKKRRRKKEEGKRRKIRNSRRRPLRNPQVCRAKLYSDFLIEILRPTPVSPPCIGLWSAYLKRKKKKTLYNGYIIFHIKNYKKICTNSTKCYIKFYINSI